MFGDMGNTFINWWQSKEMVSDHGLVTPPNSPGLAAARRSPL